ncbi:MAG: efflux transporter outer membrane subunit [Phycisphaerae bacterium]|nr:efflux transporter outer membrane subunit [Phycisphaerae bacterium]
MLSKSRKISILFLTALCFSAGCMVAPKYERPSTVADKAEWPFRSKEYTQDANSPGRWWERFDDETTNALVEKALENNYDVKIAAAKVLQAEANFKIAGGKLLPEISMDFDRQFTRRSSGPPGSGAENTAVVQKTRTYTGEFSISYVLDLFGKLRHAREAQYKTLLAAKADKNAVINSMLASVINSRLNIATLQKRVEIAKANTQSLAKTLNIVEERYKLGLVGPVDVRLARENLAAAQVAEPEIELSLKLAENTLAELLAVQPGRYEQLETMTADLPLPQDVPVGLPAALLQRRPDVVEAELKLKSQNERIGESIAKLYPDLTFTGSMGWSSNTSNPIFVDEAWIYSTLLSVSQPIFKGGQLKAQVDFDKAKFDELAATYSKTVVTAMREVQDYAVTEDLLRRKLQFAQIRFAEAKAAEELSRQRYQRGVESILTVLESERRRNTAEESLAILKGQIWNARVNLFLALGGDWTS